MQYVVEWDRSRGGGDTGGLPLTALTVEQLVMVVESDPPGEKKAIRGSAEDKEEYARLVDESKSKENTPNSTKELVEWMFKKFLRAIVNGVIRTITVVNIRGVKFFLLPKRGMPKGNNNKVGEKQTLEEAVPAEKKAAQVKENTEEEAARNAKRLKTSREELFGDLEGESEGEANRDHTARS